MIAGDKFLDEAMHAFDVFEPFKRLATATLFTLSLSDDADPQNIIDTFLKTAEEKRMFVAAVFFVGTEIGFVDETVKLVTDGERFCPLDDMLKAYGFVRPTGLGIPTSLGET